MTVATLTAFLVFLVPLAYSPGPGNAFFAAIGADSGLRAALPALAGYHAATLVVTAVIGFGLGALILTGPVAMVLGVVGSLYVAWLGVSFLRAARAAREPTTPVARRRSIGFFDGAVVLLLNPKAYYIIGLVFTNFLSPGGNQVIEVVTLSMVFTLNNLVAFVVWTIAGAALTVVFRGQRAGRWIDVGFGLTLILVAVWMGLSAFGVSPI